MTKYIVIYRAPQHLMDKMKDTPPEEKKKGMAKWMEWAKRIGSSLLDLGTPLGNAQTISQSGSEPAGSDIVGYSVLEADSMDEAKKLLEGHPHLGWDEGCQIEIHESQPMPDHA